MESETPRVKVGVGVLILKEGKILLGKRKNAHGAGEYAGPGGHLEFGETIEACAERETAEETGLKIKNIRFLAMSNLIWPSRHYVDIGVVADWAEGEPQLLEPHKCEGWDWYDPADLPENTFGCVKFYIESLKTGTPYFGTKKMAE
jgi:8-oxo-dGTP diphosphatase